MSAGRVRRALDQIGVANGRARSRRRGLGAVHSRRWDGPALYAGRFQSAGAVPSPTVARRVLQSEILMDSAYDRAKQLLINHGPGADGTIEEIEDEGFIGVLPCEGLREENFLVVLQPNFRGRGASPPPGEGGPRPGPRSLGHLQYGATVEFEPGGYARAQWAHCSVGRSSASGLGRYARIGFAEYAVGVAPHAAISEYSGYLAKLGDLSWATWSVPYLTQCVEDAEEVDIEGVVDALGALGQSARSSFRLFERPRCERFLNGAERTRCKRSAKRSHASRAAPEGRRPCWWIG